MQERAEELARMLCAEAAKPIKAARIEVERAIATLDLSADEARRGHDSTIPMDAVPSGESILAFEIAEPAGIVAVDHPIQLPAEPGYPQARTGDRGACPVVWKPSEKTPLVAGMITRIFDDAGLAHGLLNLLTGDPTLIVPILLADDRVRVITFTGSATVGWDLKERSSMKRHLLELGSNAAVYVAADADLPRAAADVCTSAFSFAGQACISAQRVYVDREVSESFLRLLREATSRLTIGDPSDEDTDVGPLITAQARDRAYEWLREATAGEPGC